MSAPFRFPDTITYWPPAGWDGYGSKTYGAPITIGGRWENVSKLITDPQGQQVMTAAMVGVDQDVDVEGFLAQGDQTGTSEPAAATGAFRIVQFRSARSVARNRTYRVAALGAA